MRPLLALAVAGTALLLGVATVAVGEQSATAAAPNAAATGSTAGCTLLSNATAVDTASPIYTALSNKELAAAAADALPTVVTTSEGGYEIVQRIPPKDWQPAAATDEELDYYGIEARPKDSDALTAWRSDWADGTKYFDATDFCVGNATDDSSTYASTQNAKWAGAYISGGSNYTKASGHFTDTSSSQPDAS